MTHVKIGKLLIAEESGAINIYRRLGNCIENYMIYSNGQSHFESYSHADEFECLQNWQGLVETLEQEQILWEGAL